MKKKLIVLLCMIVCIFALTACSEKSEPEVKNKDTITDTANQYLTQWNATNYEDVLKEFEESEEGKTADPTYAKTFSEWAEIQKKSGAYATTVETLYGSNNDESTVTIRCKYENKNVRFVFSFDSSEEVTGLTVEIEKTLAEKLEGAGLNTVLCITLVFIILIVISFLISLFRYINNFEEKINGKKKTEVQSVTNEQTIMLEQAEELTDDLELVAVITAAIAASMGEEAPADGLVVKSIKRRKSNKWKNA